MSKLLYRENSFCQNWQTIVIDTYEKDGLYFVALQETAFYPGGGGQPADSGSIAGVEVQAVEMKDDVPYYGLESQVNKQVDCQINWEHRFDLMQQHTGQHLLSASFRIKADRETVGFHLGQDDVTIDVAGDKLTDEELVEVERKANELLYDDKTISSYYVTSEQLAELPVVKQPTVTENVRIVEVEGVEYNPCGGTHVRSTGQVGLIKILKVEKQKQAQRIFFQCGKRAFDTAKTMFGIVDKAAAQFQTNRSNVLERLEKQSADLQAAVKRSEVLENQLEQLELKEIMQTEERIINRSFEGKTVKALQRMAGTVAESGKDFVILSNYIERKLVFAHHIEGMHSGSLFRESLAAFNGKGGGNAQIAQASFSAQEDMDRYIDFLKAHYQSIV
ncbi:alanyl-tRNA editing protein [Terribacillus sp. DMT04]|uniref:alanyl-tRNA editing protein n=1 Tax=Terribacillus sp. DMT04 TaxID=2850441 RepID=UPI001C2C7DD5|nr:alanyl-tRNA editing protein [Terribacillus sp. DMT04]QXE02950.1 hydrolase [Terribacillus sp. DMT04]